LPAGAVWIAAERMAQFQALWPHGRLEPAIVMPAVARDPSPEEALREILRGRLEGQGPITQDALGQPLGLGPAQVAGALAALESEGFAMRGRFTPGAAQEEWCERRLLARIHGYTIKRLRSEIEPVAARDFLRFLSSWQRVAEEARMEGPDALDEVVEQLEGFGAPAAAWETEILPARLAGYEPAWLDDRCLAGHLTWTRLAPRNGRNNGSDRRAAPVRTTPIALLARRHVALWTVLAAKAETAEPSPRAQEVVLFLGNQGASFFDEMVAGSGLLRSQLEAALAELVALGLVTCDSFAGLRALLVPSDRRQPFAGARRRRRTVAYGMESAGRWSLVRRVPLPEPLIGDSAAVEHLARTLLRRYGVVFWRLLEREAAWLPPWRDLLRVYRKLERRGEIRGGRFVAGFAGEQFALPDAVGALREARRKPPSNALVSVSGADPLNLVGILTPGPRLPALTGNRLLYRDGVPVALLAGGEVAFLEAFEPAMEWQARMALQRSAMPTQLAHQIA